MALRALVTGAAGFIGSHLCDRLLSDGWEVVAVDSFSSYYDVSEKEANAAALNERGLVVEKLDLLDADLGRLLDGVDVVFHQAGQPGVRSSWADLPSYTSNNILATQKLLDAAKGQPLRRFVFASSSSVYGDALTYPTTEDTQPKPINPYGVTKLAAEHLCSVYSRNWNLPVAILRYFTVYGPRQRPDMAMHRLIEAAVSGKPFPLFGTGSQIRDFTYVGDVVGANLAAAMKDSPAGSIVNIAGGDATSVSKVIAIVEMLTGRQVALDRTPPQAGDVERTGASTVRAQALMGWSPTVSVSDGLEKQVAWHLARQNRQRFASG